MGKSRDKARVTIRFTQEQFLALEEAAKANGMSLAKMTRSLFLTRALPRPLMHRDDVRLLFAALTKVSNQINLFWRAGGRTPAQAMLEEIRDALVSIRLFVVRNIYANPG